MDTSTTPYPLIPILSSLHHLLLIHGKRLQILQLDTAQRLLVRRLQHHPRNFLIIIPGPCLKCFLPPAHTKTPFTAIREPHLAQVVAAGSTKVEKLLGHNTRDGVVTCVRGRDFAVAGAGEACEGLRGVQGKGLLKDCDSGVSYCIASQTNPDLSVVVVALMVQQKWPWAQPWRKTPLQAAIMLHPTHTRRTGSRPKKWCLMIALHPKPNRFIRDPAK